MKRELDDSFYDNAYISSEKYSANYRRSPYYKIWQHIVGLLDKDSVVADFGCGPGQFAHMLRDNKIKYAYGTDFSAVAVKKASKLVKARFVKADIYNEDTYLLDDYNTAICLEVLEHLDNDLYFFEALPADTRVIITVPDFDSVSHVRYFPTMDDVKARYGDKFRISGSKTFELGKKKIHLLHGRKV